jgi:hypothetical protein
MRVTRSFLSFLSFVLTISVLINAMPIAAQNGKPAPAPNGDLRYLLETNEPAEVFRQYRKSGRNVAFSPMLKVVAGAEAKDIEAALDAQAVNFFEEFAAAGGVDVAKIHDKAKTLNKKTYEELKKNPPQSKAAPKKLPRAIGKSFAGEDLFPLEFEGTLSAPLVSAPDGPEVQKTETETGMTATATDTRSMDMAGSTVTRTETATSKAGTDGKEIFTGSNRTTKTEVISKAENKKLNITDKMAWESGFAMCPDAQGRLSGHGRASLSTQLVTTVGNRIAAITQEVSVDYKLTGYVNDDAVFTHFTIEAEGRETLTGYDRARDLGLLGEDKGLHDGTGSVKFRLDDCKPPYETERNEYGSTKIVDAKMGNGPVTLDNPIPGSDLLSRFIPAGAALIMIDMNTLMMSTIANIKNGECVDVECTAAKNTLKSGETIDVTVVSVSKRDLDKFNARLETTTNATPEKQIGTPTAVFIFTADAGGGGTFMVKSTSRRGIGLGMLQFGKEGENDLDKDKCDGNWHGTIEIRRTFEEVQKEVTKPGDQKSDLLLSGWKEIINRQKYDGTVRIGDVQLATPGTWVLNAAFDMGGNWYYLDHAFFTTPNECGWYVKKTIKEDNGLEKREEGGGSGVTDVTIQVQGTEYRGNSVISEMKGAFTSRTWHHPSGYCQDGNNQPTDYNKSGETTFSKVPINFEGKIDPSNPDVLTGTKTATSEDGRETTTITWNIKRCSPVKPKPPVKRK